MSEQSNEGDFGELALDPQERSEAQTYLDEPDAVDDVPWSPPDRQPRGAEFADLDTEETIEQRIMQEEPEEGTAYGRPDPAGEGAEVERELLGGDDPDAIPADQDVLGGAPGDDEVVQGEGPEIAAMRVVEGGPGSPP